MEKPLESSPPPTLEVVKPAPVSLDHVLDQVCRAYKIETPAGREFLKVALANAQLMDRKQRDYGPRNISGFGMFGVVVRMNDKFERIKNLFNNRRKKATNEGIRDSLRDISNYANIAIMLDEGSWPKE